MGRSSVKYPWQRYVLDAATEPQPALVPQKVRCAREAIVDRRLEMIDETIALKDAERTLEAIEKSD